MALSSCVSGGSSLNCAAGLLWVLLLSPARHLPQEPCSPSQCLFSASAGCWLLQKLSWLFCMCLSHHAVLEWIFLLLDCQCYVEGQINWSEFFFFYQVHVKAECNWSTWCKFFPLFRCGFKIVEHAIRNMLVQIIHLLLLSQQFSPPGCLHPC